MWDSSQPEVSSQTDTRKPIRKVLFWILAVAGVLFFIVYSYNVQNSAPKIISWFLLCIDTKDYEGVSSLLHVEGAAVNKDTARALIAWLDSRHQKTEK